MYSSLLSDQPLLTIDPISSLHNLSHQPTEEQLRAAHSQWLDLETRHRLLLLCSILDTQRSIFFQQPPFNSLPPNPNFPRPATPLTWESASLPTWLATFTSQAPTATDPFTFALTHSLHMQTEHTTISSTTPTPLLHAFLLLTHTPLTALLLTAAESWLFARKEPSPTTWAAAKSLLRAWCASDNAATAAWHAGFVLRAAFPTSSPSASGNGRGHDLSLQSLGLHAPWLLYVAVLVCWAYSGVGGQEMGGLHGYLAGLCTENWTAVGGLRGQGGARDVVIAVAGVVRSLGGGALLAEAGGVLERIEAGRVRV